MFNENQDVKTKWTNKNRDRYKQYGYEYTGINTVLYVKAGELLPTSREKVIAVCDYCGKEYSCYYCVIIRDKYNIQCCKECAPIKANNLRKEKYANRYIIKAKTICDEKGYTLLSDKTDYNGVNGYLEFICPKHGIQKMSLCNLIKGHECRMCSYDKRKESRKYPREKLESIIRADGNILLNANEYESVFSNNLNIQCSCGEIFTVSLKNYIERNQRRCKLCSNKESVAELRIRRYLEINNIQYEQEKRFKDCRDKRELPFDFYLPEYNTCIEFDGQHHYKNIFTNCSLVQKHDSIKNRYCENHNIKLLRIPYFKGNNIEEIIDKYLMQIQDKDIV